MHIYIYIYIGGLMDYISQKIAAYGQFVLVFKYLGLILPSIADKEGCVLSHDKYLKFNK